jgi:4-diphosphocytidyl-2-C-methyl-D-erythritol kinase
MVVFPNAKINIGLNILSKREDGYHNISSCFYPINFYDVLEILPSKKFSFQSTGIAIPDSKEENLCVKAYQLLHNDYGIEPMQIHLHKNIPIGAGLGGGSADASFTIKVINDLYTLGLNDEQMEAYAGRLGSDCPFFIKNKPVIAEGVGDVFKPIEVDLSEKYLMLVYPDIHIGTKEAYAGVVPLQPQNSIADILNSGIQNWKNKLHNDFEKSILPTHQKIQQLKDQMYNLGAEYASMTGSGSAVYGIFNKQVEDLPSTVWSGFLA